MSNKACPKKGLTFNEMVTALNEGKKIEIWGNNGGYDDLSPIKLNEDGSAGECKGISDVP
jgi:hypothetical protein